MKAFERVQGRFMRMLHELECISYRKRLDWLHVFIVSAVDEGPDGRMLNYERYR